MSIIKGALKGAVAMKVIQVAQRELSKPENQRKIKSALQKVQQQIRKPR